MIEVQTTAALHDLSSRERCAGRSIGLVPTMGALHAGHLSLVRGARDENDLVIMSVFVNPAQFGPTEDFEQYPRDLDRDRALAATAGVDILFAPSLEDMYPGGADAQVIWVDPGAPGDRLEGTSRPGHFRGVLSLILKLLNAAQPRRTYFGQKDGQQAALITRMVAELSLFTEVRVLDTVREPDGLALSSRNIRLSPDERRQAVVLSQALQRAQALFAGGTRRSADLLDAMQLRLETASLARIDYTAVVDLATFEPIDGPVERAAMLAVAIRFGRTRLIDNAIVDPHGPARS